MKNHLKLLISLLMLSLILSSCSKEPTDADPNEEVPVYNTLDDILGTSHVPYFETKNMERASYTSYTVTGYDSKKLTSQNNKGMFGAELANLLGVSSGYIYIFDIYEVRKNIQVGNADVKQLESPQCGLVPMTSTNKIGYMGALIDGTYNMATTLVYIKTDMNGRQYNKWTPTALESLKWNYGIYN